MDLNKIKKIANNYHKIISDFVQPHPNAKNHGINHWLKVAQTAGQLASLADEPENVILSCIAAGILHDIAKVDDKTSKDPYHGEKGVELCKKHNLLKLLNIQKQHWELIYEAIQDHSHGLNTTDLIAKYLWDADRLCYLGFNEAVLDADRMSTQVWRKLCK